MNTDELVLLGIKGSVLALNKHNGQIAWSTSLGGSAFVTLARDASLVYAYTNGWIYCLELTTGKIIWSNGLKGYGYALATICPPGASSGSDIATRTAIIAAAEQQQASEVVAVSAIAATASI